MSRHIFVFLERQCASRHVFTLAVIIMLVAAACSRAMPYTLNAVGPFAFPSVSNPSLERVAIVVTITNHSGDDLQITATDFVARDADHRVFAASPTAPGAGTGLETIPVQIRGSLPLPTITLRSDDVLSGFVVFDVPVGVRPVELVWRQTDSDVVTNLSAAR